MQLLACDSFLRACERWQAEGRLLSLLDRCIQLLATNPRHPGLNTEQLVAVRDIPVCSARLNIQFRLIFAWPDPQTVILLHFDNHDEAYDWTHRSLNRIPRLVNNAQLWRGRDITDKPAALPRVDEDQLVPLAGADALRHMLQRGIHHYIAALDETQRSYVTFDFRERTGLVFVRGGAGTGKTAIAIHRAMHLAQEPEFDRQGVQYLCYNQVLEETVRETIRKLNGGRMPSNLYVSTFHSWCGWYLRQRGFEVPSGLDQSNLLAGEVRRSIARLGLGDAIGRSVADVVDEIRALKRLGLASVQEYATLDRRGMRFALKQSQREAIWRVYEEVRYRPGGKPEYDDLPVIALEELESDDEFPGYRAVIVDEAQDCSPVMARLARRMVRDGHRRLMVLADPAQGIYQNGFAWARREFAPRGAQNVVLRTPYRSTREIYACASSIYAGHEELQRDLEDLRDGVRNGPLPIVGVYSDKAEAAQALTDSVRAELEDATPGQRRPQEVAVLVPRRCEKDYVVELLRDAAIPASPIDRNRVDLESGTVKVATIHSAKGLDFPSVYVFRFDAAHLEPAEARALLYVAMTRSSWRLTLISDKNRLSPLLSDLDPETYTLIGTAKGLLAV